MEREYKLKIAIDITDLINEGKLFDAFAKLRKFAANLDIFDVTNKIESLEQSYKYLIKYASDGVADPQRNEIYKKICADMMSILDNLVVEFEIASSNDLYNKTIRDLRANRQTIISTVQKYSQSLFEETSYKESIQGNGDDVQLFVLRQNREAVEATLFNAIWVSSALTDEEIAVINELLKAESTSLRLKELVINALMMHLLSIYDEKALFLLIDYYSVTSDCNLRIKALVSLIIAMECNSGEVKESQSVAKHIQILSDNPCIKEDVPEIFLQFIRSRGTGGLRKRIKEEFVPQLKKLRPDIRNMMSGLASDDLEDLSSNPDWQEMLDKSGITDKMMELNKMQMEGNDVFFASFEKLKTFPFFSTVSNWFLPFDPEQSDIARVLKGVDKAMFMVINKTGSFCDSDKYSFFLSLNTVPESQRSMMMSGLEEQNLSMLEELESLPNPKEERRTVANKYVQNLYRFFSIFWPKRGLKSGRVVNPFELTMNLAQMPYIRKYVEDADSLRLVGELYMNQLFYNDALSVFCTIESISEPSATLYQKLAYCYEQSGDYQNAIDCYNKVELFKSDDLWTMKHLAMCYRRVGETGKAISIYLRLEAMKPEDVSIANAMGNCYMEMGDFRSAIKSFFKVDYLAPKGAKTLRPIAWCSFKSANYQQSIDYYNKIIEKEATAEDYANKGHALLLLGNVKEATECYKMSVQISSLPEFDNIMKGDISDLLSSGVDEKLLLFVCDEVRYYSQTL